MTDATPETKTVGGWLPAGTCGAESVLRVGGQVIGSLSCTLEAGHDIEVETELCYAPEQCGISAHQYGGMSATHPGHPSTPHQATIIWGNAPVLESCEACQLGKHLDCIGLTWDKASQSTDACPCHTNNRGMHP